MHRTSRVRDRPAARADAVLGRAASAACTLLIGSALVIGCAGSPQQDAGPRAVPGDMAASCAAPTASVEPHPVRAGDRFTVSGEGWAPCLDVVEVDEQGHTTTPGDTGPWTVTITWVQADERLELASLQPVDGVFERELAAPAEVTADATIEVASVQYVPVLTLPVGR